MQMWMPTALKVVPMPTYESRLVQHAERLGRPVPPATAHAIQTRLAGSSVSAVEELPNTLRLRRPLAMAAAVTAALAIGAWLQPASDSLAPAEVVQVSHPLIGSPGRLSATVEEMARNAATAEDALLQEWRLIRSDLQRLQESLGQRLAESGLQTDSA